jgi:tricorn protease
MNQQPGYLRFPHIVGNQIVFVAEDDVWLASAEGGRASRLTADTTPAARPRLSPDGSHVAWISRRAGSPEAFVMPVAGGQARQLTYLGSASTTLSGFAPDGRLIVLSSGGRPFRSQTWAYAISVEDPDAIPQQLAYGPVNALAWAASGQLVAGTGYLRDHAHWKRYRGGTAGRLWSAPSEDGEFSELLAELEGPKSHPTFVGDRLSFLADFSGHGNVYSVNAEGTDLRRHTDHDDFYARQLGGDGSRLVYQHAGQLWLLEDLAADSQSRRIELSLGSPRAGRIRRRIDPVGAIGRLDVDRTGRASAVEVRGNVVWLTHRNGPARTIAAVDGVRHRCPVVLNSRDGQEPASVAYVTDAEGDDAVEIAAPDGSTRRFADGQIGRVLELVASPDGSTLALASHDGRLLTLEVAGGALTELEANPNGDPTGLAFSPDSAWLAYSAAEQQESLRSIRLAELSTGRITSVTVARFLDSDPEFSLDGKYLFFLSARTFDPVYDVHVFDLAFPLATRPYLVTLAADTTSPFEPELAGRSDEPGPAPSAEARDQDDGNAIDEVASITVDIEGIGDRVVAFPVAAGRLADLRAVKGGLVWTDSPVAGELGESRNPGDDIRPALRRWDFGKRKLMDLADRIDAVEVSGDGTKLVIRDKDAWKVVPADHKPSEDGEETVEIDLSRITLSVDPPAEWRQMLDETARLMRDHYWIEDMAGIDWAAVVDRYRPLVDSVASRDDLSDLLWEVNGETGTSHAYETPPPPKDEPLTKPAFLGADLARDEAGQWVIQRIVSGDNSARDARSPLTAPGVNAAPGDVILAVNGRPVPSSGPAGLLRGTADKPVELRLSRGEDSRSVVIKPLADDVELRYLDWVAGRRAIVHAASDGRVGYVHIPDMVSSGWAAFHRDLTVEMARDGLIVDTRDNRGGHTSQLVIEKLARRVIGWDTARHHPEASYPEAAPRGPLVSLANEWAGSDGDIVNAAFQSLDLGPVIGTRTWGGVIGIDGRYQLVDGTSVTQPRYAFWFTKFGWGVENHGVDPDVVVEFAPHAWGRGEDPQLRAGIDYVLAELNSRPAVARPDIASRPSRQAPPLPPRP